MQIVQITAEFMKTSLFLHALFPPYWWSATLATRAVMVRYHIKIQERR